MIWRVLSEIRQVRAEQAEIKALLLATLEATTANRASSGVVEKNSKMPLKKFASIVGFKEGTIRYWRNKEKEKNGACKWWEEVGGRRFIKLDQLSGCAEQQYAKAIEKEWQRDGIATLRVEAQSHSR